ncbi:hypothetical protein ACWDUC_37590 [Streptomyces tricolor]
MAAEAAEEARQLRSCEDCGLPEAAGLCPACASRRRVDGLVRDADAVYAAYRRRHNRRTKEAAEQAADAAGLRTAEALLGRLLDQLDAARRRASAA